MIRYVALLMSIILTGLGVLGLAAPETFLAAVAYFQAANRVYLAGALRCLVGIVVYSSAPDSRAPRLLRVLGVLGVVLGVMTPILHKPLPMLVAGLWSGEHTLPWALSCIAVGLVLIAALAPPREFED